METTNSVTTQQSTDFLDHLLSITKDDAFLRLRLENILEMLENKTVEDVDQKYRFELKKFGDEGQVKALINGFLNY